MTCNEKILSEDYGELIIDFTVPVEIQDPIIAECLTVVNERFSIAYVPLNYIDRFTSSLYRYDNGSRVYGLMQEAFDPISLANSGIIRTQRPPLSLTGRGVVMAFIDTGIRYAEPMFLNSAGNTRLLTIWDQTIQTGTPPDGYNYGSLFTRDDINKALQAKNPYAVVPSTDEDGHGTAMASVAAGSILDGGYTFWGAAPEADIVVIKLRQAKKYLRDFYFIPEGVPAYGGADIMLGVKFAESFARTMQKPVVICIGMGTNTGNHVLGSPLARYLNDIAINRNRSVVICGGNEGNAAHHFSGSVPEGVNGYRDVEIRVGEGEGGFLVEMWGNVPNIFDASVKTPGGETIPRFKLGVGSGQRYTFVYEKTVITIQSILVEAATGEELIIFRFEAPTPGVWTIRVFNQPDEGNGVFNMWLPITQFLKSNTFFLNSSPYITLTDPGIAEGAITVSTYNDVNNSFYVNSGRGFLRNGMIKPDFAAPGVGISTALGRRTGSSLAAAITAGGVAQFLQWAVVQQNNLLITNPELKSYFIRGATRSSDLEYPNRNWGYGRLNVTGVFDVMARV
ncbi:MAG TPA: S8 family peptidase [Lachnospiraceae bacterium]|nr:S8 family peptidase [Lachnospiraceae bacterium]